MRAVKYHVLQWPSCLLVRLLTDQKWQERGQRLETLYVFSGADLLRHSPTTESPGKSVKNAAPSPSPHKSFPVLALDSSVVIIQFIHPHCKFWGLCPKELSFSRSVVIWWGVFVCVRARVLWARRELCTDSAFSAGKPWLYLSLPLNSS